MASLYTNADGLTQAYGPVRTPALGYVKKVSGGPTGGVLVVDFDVNNLPDFDQDASGGGTMDSFGELQAYVPANAYIKSATILVQTALSGGTTPTLTVGLYKKDGTAIDADGIDATIAAAALAAGKVVDCDGALVGGTDGIGAAAGYIKAATAGGPTAGAFRLIVEYVYSGA
jgi:hypothetical protein